MNFFLEQLQHSSYISCVYTVHKWTTLVPSKKEKMRMIQHVALTAAYEEISPNGASMIKLRALALINALIEIL